MRNPITVSRPAKSLPICFALSRNYQWEMNQPPTTVVPNLIGLALKTSTERARSVHLDTRILEQTWYTDLSPGRITLQSPDPGQRVPFDPVIGLELAINPPATLAPLKKATR
jgi:beta-lactam-binding protein with PASTA domain